MDPPGIEPPYTLTCSQILRLCVARACIRGKPGQCLARIIGSLWTRGESNSLPHPCEGCALPNELLAHLYAGRMRCSTDILRALVATRRAPSITKPCFGDTYASRLLLSIRQRRIGKIRIYYTSEGVLYKNMSSQHQFELRVYEKLFVLARQ